MLICGLALGRCVAESFVVTQSGDDGPGSLRDAVVQANVLLGTDTIRFNVAEPVILKTPLPALTDDVVFIGLGPRRTIISGNGRTNGSSLFQVNAGATAVFAQLTIQNAVSSAPGAAIHNSGRITLETCLIANNHGLESGGAIFSSGELLCISSTICSNTVAGRKRTDIVAGGGGARGNGGGIYISGGVGAIFNCTFSGNLAVGGKGGDTVDPTGPTGGGGGGGGESSGGAIFLQSGSLLLINATLTENQAVGGPGGEGSGGGGMGGAGVSRGGGIYNDNGNLRLLNTLVAGNRASVWTDLASPAGLSVSLGHNLVGSVVTNQNGSDWLRASDILNNAAQLEPLGDYGGPTPTHRLGPNSPAIDHGASLAEGAPDFDQRGAARPQGAGVDIGAVEFGRIKQTIEFGPLSRKTYGDAPFQVGAEASSGLPAAFSIVNNLHASVIGNLIRITGAGLATVEASQAGDENYFPAEINPKQSFAIQKAQLVITAIAGASPTRAYRLPNPDFAALVAFQFQGFIPGDSVQDLDALPVLSSSATPASPVGTYPLLLSGGSDDNYDLVLTPPQIILTVVPAIQNIKFPAIGDKTYGFAPFAPIASVDSGLPLVFSVTSGPAEIAGGEIAINGAGTVSVTAVPVANPNYLPASASQSFTVKKAPLKVKCGDLSRMFGQPNQVLPIVYSGFKPDETSAVLDLLPTAVTAAHINSPPGAYPITVSGGSDTNYELSGYQAGTLTIVPATQAISFDLIPAKSFGDVFAASATASSGLPIVFSVESGPATVSGPWGSTVTVNGTGTITLRASQAGAANYLEALPVTRTFMAVKAPLTVLAEDAARVFGQANPVLRVLYSGFKLGDTALVLDFPPTAATAATVSSPAGQYPITVAGGSDEFYEFRGYLPGSLTIDPAAQTLDFPPILGAVYGDAFTAKAVATSGLPISFSVESGPATATGPNGSTITITNLGTITLKAAQRGDSNFLAAAPMTQSFTVGKAALTVSAADAAKVFGSPIPSLTVVYKGLKLGETSAVLDQAPFISTIATASSPVGFYPITVSGGADDHYELQGYLPGILSVKPSGQTILFGAIGARDYGDVFTLTATASSGLPVTFSVEEGAAVVSGPNGSTVTVTNRGTVKIKATQEGNANFASAPPVFQSFSVGKSILNVRAADASRVYGIPNPSLTVLYSGLKLGETSASLDVPPTLQTVATVASPTGHYPITVSGGSDDNYDLQGYQAGTLTVTQAPQSIVFDTIPPKAYGQAFTAEAVSSSGLPVSFVVESGPAMVSGLNGSTIIVTNRGIISILAAQTGDGNYLSASPVSQSFTVGRAPLTVAAGNVSRVFGQANPGLPVFYTGFKLGETNSVLDTQPAAFTAATAESPVGEYLITVTGGADDNYLLQGFQPGTLSITPASQVIVFDTIPPKAYGDVFTAEAVSSSGLPVSFAIESGPALASGPNGATITVTNPGIVTIKASQPGGGNFGAAANALRSFTVVKSVLTAKANDITRRSGQPNPAFEIVYSGFKLGETSAVLDVPPTASTAATAASAPGTYPISLSGGADDHYDLLSTPGILTVVSANTPPVVTLLSPIHGSTYIRPVSLPLIADATDAEGPVAQVQFFDQGALVGSTNQAPFSVIWTNVPTGVHRVTALAVDSEGDTALSNEAEFTVLEHLPFIVGLIDTNSVLMRQTGLFQQKVTITNPTPDTLRGIRLLIADLPVGASVHNATGKTNGVDYIQYDLPLLSGASVVFQIEYYVPTRAVPSPTISTQLILGEPLPDLEGTPVTILRFLPLQTASYLVEFDTELGRDYYVQYSPDLTHWKTGRPALRGNGSSIQWIDNGPPKTDSPPNFQTSRYYRIISVP